ncbi:CoA ester lyase [Thalassotalea maritima]|uniref:HpcH/HpaI aldolase/citrate lyase family protein n=1 Tax=Thalassotalea maritima TaxID=3242416 RepID=UPI003527E385
MTLPLLRSVLFVSGSQPKRFIKAFQSGADAVCIDLEDAVLPKDKDAARSHLVNYLDSLMTTQQQSSCPLLVRINPITSDEGRRDIEALMSRQNCPTAIILAKTNSVDDIITADTALANSSIGLIALLETVAGIVNAASIATASDRLEAIMFGGADYSAEIGCDFSFEPLLLARLQLCQVKGLKCLQLIDVPHIHLNDLDACHQESVRVKALGFTAKAAIHPKQLSAIHQAFSPSVSEINQAMDIVMASHKASDGAICVNGQMVDKPVVLAAQRTLELAMSAGIDHSAIHSEIYSTTNNQQSR